MKKYTRKPVGNGPRTLPELGGIFILSAHFPFLRLCPCYGESRENIFMALKSRRISSTRSNPLKNDIHTNWGWGG